MCATKPIAAWPHSPSRTSSRACALLGIRSSPRQALSPISRSGVVGVVGDRDRAGVRHRHRHRAHADDAGHPEALHDLADGAGEGLPAVVGLGPLEQQVRRLTGVVQQPHDQPRRVVRLVVVAHERHRRAAGPVVVELVDVEGRHDRALAEVDEVPGGPGGGVAGVEEAVEDQHHRQAALLTGLAGRRGVELGHVVDDVHETGFLRHGGVLPGGERCGVRHGQHRSRPRYSPGRRSRRAARGGGDDTHTGVPLRGVVTAG